MPIEPGTTLALRAGLAGMRTELAKAQRKDPRLSEIISRLKREPAGSYLSEPRGAEMKKVTGQKDFSSNDESRWLRKSATAGIVMLWNFTPQILAVGHKHRPQQNVLRVVDQLDDEAGTA